MAGTSAYPAALDSFTNPTSTDTLDSATVPHATQHANANDAIESIEAELGVLPKGGYATVRARLDALGPTNGVYTAPLETTNVVTAAATGTINVDVSTASVWYYTLSASANFTLNIRASSSVALNTLMANGQSVTVAFLNTNGATPYYATAFQVDGTSVTPKWAAGAPPTFGNASSVDVYTLTILKTGSATFSVFGSQNKYA